jgi:hypothetical protein
MTCRHVYISEMRAASRVIAADWCVCCGAARAPIPVNAPTERTTHGQQEQSERDCR